MRYARNNLTLAYLLNQYLLPFLNRATTGAEIHTSFQAEFTPPCLSHFANRIKKLSYTYISLLPSSPSIITTFPDLVLSRHVPTLSSLQYQFLYSHCLIITLLHIPLNAQFPMRALAVSLAVCATVAAAQELVLYVYNLLSCLTKRHPPERIFKML